MSRPQWLCAIISGHHWRDVGVFDVEPDPEFTTNSTDFGVAMKCDRCGARTWQWEFAVAAAGTPYTGDDR